MSDFEYTPAQLVSAALSAIGEGKQDAAEGIIRLLATHYPHETELLAYVARGMNA